MTFTPLCPNCNKRMEIHKSMSGLHWYCPSYWSCGGIINKVESKREIPYVHPSLVKRITQNE